MIRRHRWLVGLGCLAALLLALALAWNWDWFKPLAQAKLSSTLDRPVTIGHLQVDLGRYPTLALVDVDIDNPAGFPGGGRFATVSRLAVKLDPWPLFHRRVVLDWIQVDGLHANLDAPPDAKPNWTLPQKGGGTIPAGSSSTSAPPVAVGSIAIRNSSVHVRYPRHGADMELAIRTLPDTAAGGAPSPGESHGEQMRIEVDIDGSYSGQPISGRLLGGALLALSNANHPYPLDFRVVNGATELHLEGTLNDPLQLAGADVRVELQGHDMADLYPLTGVTLPHTAGFRIGGRLGYANDSFHFTDFSGTVGQSDLEGNIAVDLRPTPRKITMTLHSKAVDMVDLGGFIGAKPRQGEAAQNLRAADGHPGVLPDTPINLPELRSDDLDVHYTAAHIADPRMPLDNLVAHLTTDSGALRLDPLKFGVGHGAIEGSVLLAPVSEQQVHLQTTIDFRELDLGHILGKSAGIQGEGTIGGKLVLDGTGRSAAGIAAAGNGDLKLFISGGNISALLVNLAGLDLGRSLLSALGLPQRTQLRCMVSHWSLDRGIVNTPIMLIDTGEANIIGTGTVNLRDNTIDYRVKTNPKHFSIGSVAAPIVITGALKDPSIRPNLADVGARGGIAGALAVVAPPLAALVATIQLGLGKNNDCGALIREVSNAGHR